jgi:hypothetical protein
MVLTTRIKAKGVYLGFYKDFQIMIYADDLWASVLGKNAQNVTRIDVFNVELGPKRSCLQFSTYPE